MSCNKCNRRKNVKSGSDIKKVLDFLNDGLCKIVVRRVNENNPAEIYCTTQKEVTPGKGSSNYYTGDSIKSVIRNGFIMVWTLNKNIIEGGEKESGWLKIQISEIIGYEFMDRIPTKGKKKKK